MQSGWTQVFRGESVTLKCDIEGGEDKWTYSWYKNGAENPTIKQSENTFEVSDEARFTCMGNRIGGDPQSTEMSDPVTLSMLGECVHLYVFRTLNFTQFHIHTVSVRPETVLFFIYSMLTWFIWTVVK